MARKVVRTRAGKEWTEARFFAFLRTGLRQMSNRWPPIVRHCPNAARRKYEGPNKRQKWEYQCAKCKQWMKRTELYVDHIVPVGSLKSFEDLGPFCERLFCESDGLQMLCKECDTTRGKRRG